MIIKGASGLGDSIYLHPITCHHLAKGETDITVMTNYPELFQDLPVKTIRHSKDYADKKISYCSRKYHLNSTQWEDVCIAADVGKKLDLRIKWGVKNQALVDLVKKRAKGKEFVVVATPYKPFGREDEFGKEMTLDYRVVDKLIKNNPQYFWVQTGREDALYKLPVDLDLNRKTTAADVMDLVVHSKGVVAPVGHMLPICESLNKRMLCFFSRNGLNCENRFISSIKPQKVIHKKHLVSHVVDDESMESIQIAFNEVVK